jgi:hypothetical protein
MKHSIPTVLIVASMVLITLGSCCKQPVQAAQTKWRTEYVRDTSTALCNRITNADSAIVFMDHLFVPLYSDKGIKLGRAIEQSVLVWIPGVTSNSCIIRNYYCPEYLLGRDVEVAFSLFAHPSQLEEWRELNRNFTQQDKEWNLSVQFPNIYCQRLSGLKIKNGKIAWAK